MSFLTLCKWTVLSGILLIWTIKLIIRPNFQTDPELIYILGVAPNLVGSYLLLFGSYWCFSNHFIFYSPAIVRLQCYVFFLMLVMNEYLQRIPWFGRTFDYHDIVFSALGLSLSYVIFNTMTRKEISFREKTIAA